MSIEAMKLALVALEDAQYFIEAELNNRMDLYKNYPNLAHKYAGEQQSLRKNQEAITALRQAIEQAPQSEARGLSQQKQEPEAIKAEREACAKACEEFARKWWKIHCDSNLHYSSTLKAHQDFCALQAAIRARGHANGITGEQK